MQIYFPVTQKKFPVRQATGISAQVIEEARDFRCDSMTRTVQSNIFPVIFPVHGKSRRYTKL
jgi:hypothetical protein